MQQTGYESEVPASNAWRLSRPATRGHPPWLQWYGCPAMVGGDPAGGSRIARASHSACTLPVTRRDGVNRLWTCLRISNYRSSAVRLGGTGSAAASRWISSTPAESGG